MRYFLEEKVYMEHLCCRTSSKKGTKIDRNKPFQKVTELTDRDEILTLRLSVCKKFLIRLYRKGLSTFIIHYHTVYAPPV